MRLLRLLLCACAIGAMPAISFAGERGVPASHGILNFGKVNDHLYRGAQPDANGIANLKKLGVVMIINLRTSEEMRETERIEAASNSLLYTNIPLRGMSRPSDRDIGRILSIIENSPGPVFVHCEHGCDRTGTVIACYRIQHDGSDVKAAIEEADHYGMSGLERGMRAYVAEFAHKKAKENASDK